MTLSYLRATGVSSAGSSLCAVVRVVDMAAGPPPNEEGGSVEPKPPDPRVEPGKDSVIRTSGVAIRSIIN